MIYHDYEALADALQNEQNGLKVCYKHPEIVIYDELECPACKVVREFNLSTRRKLRP
jgi:hypothetical protein